MFRKRCVFFDVAAKRKVTEINVELFASTFHAFLNRGSSFKEIKLFSTFSWPIVLSSQAPIDCLLKGASGKV